MERLLETVQCTFDQIHGSRSVVLHSTDVAQVNQSVDMVRILTKNVLGEEDQRGSPTERTDHDPLKVVLIDEIEVLHFQPLVVFVEFVLKVISRRRRAGLG